MVMQPEVLAIIPARGGSKSIPRKNIQPFAGHPLIAYSIAAGLQAKTVTRVIVSTDDVHIAEIARGYGAEAPFLRPADLALDTTTDFPVIAHALQWLTDEEGFQPEVIVQLRPTSPLRPVDLVDRAVDILLRNPQADCVRGVAPSGQNPYKMWRIEESGQMRPLLESAFDEPYNMPRQKLPQTYWQTGHIDAFRSSTVIEKQSLTGDTILPLMLNPCFTADIDTVQDWERAEWALIHGDLDIVLPGQAPRPLPDEVDLVVLDFDGVLTDNRVWTDADGRETVAANRGDGLGIERLKERGVQVMVLSRETNPVVAARCRKLNLEVIQGVQDKAAILKEFLKSRGISPKRSIYLGNDVNDVPCFPVVACAIAVADAHPQARRAADLRLRTPGGCGAVRELCDLLIERMD